MVVEKGYKLTEVGVIPEAWEVKFISDLAEVDSENLTSQTSPDYQFNYISLEDVDTGTLRSYTEHVFSKAPSRAKRKIRTSDILVSTVRPNLKSHLLASEVINNWICSTGFSVLRVKSGVNSAFLYNHFFGNIVNKQIDNLITGSNYPAINSKEIKSLLIPSPNTYEEQTAIANALSDMDALIAQTEKLIEKKKAIKQGVMQELLKPKEGWVTKKLGENTSILRGGSPRPIEDFLTTTSDGINWIKIGDVGKTAKYITSTDEKITPAGMSRSRIVKPGDFLLSNSMSFGRPYIMQISGCIHDGWLVITEYESNFDRDFLYYVLGSEAIFTQYKSMASGSSVLNLSKEIVKEVKVICPKYLDEQKQIARILSDIDIDIDFTENKLQKLKNQKQGMMQALLTGKIRLI